MAGSKFDIFLVLFLGSFFLNRADLVIGFSLKPYMLMCLFVALLSLRIQLRLKTAGSYEIFFLLFFFWYCASALMTPDQFYALRMVLGVLIFISCYLISGSFLSKYPLGMIEKSLTCVFGLFNVVSLVAYLAGLALSSFVTDIAPNQIFFGMMLDREMPRLIGVTSNPDYYYLTAFISLYYFLYRSDEKKFVFLGALAALNIILTLSIGAIFAMLAGGFLVLAMDFKKFFRLFFKFAFFSFPVILVVFMNDFVQSIIEKRLQQLLSTGSGRYAVWRTALDTFTENPILGVGAYGFREISIRMHAIVNAHNTFLEVLVETGLLGFVLFVLANILLAVRLFKSAKVFPASKFLFPSLISMWISMLSVSATIYPAYLFLLVVASRYLSEQNNHQ